MYFEEVRETNRKLFTFCLVYFIVLVNLVGFLVFESETIMALNDPSQPPEGGYVIVNGDWEVTDVREYYNCTIIMNGNLIVKNGGTLTFHNVTLIMNNTFNGSFNIEVQSGGTFYIYDFDNSSTTNLDRSNITSVNPNYHYNFWVREGANFTMKNSELHECGYNSPNEGLKIETNRTEIKDSILSNNFIGINYYYSVENNIAGNTFSNNLYGIVLDYADSNNITGNNIHSNNQHGIYLVYSDLNQIIDNIVHSNYGFGIYLFRSSWNNITGNNALDNEEGIHFDSSSGNIIIGNNISNNEDGIYISYSDNNSLTGNTISSNKYSGISFQWSSWDNINYNTMSENSIVIYGNLLEYWNTHNIETSNKVNGKSVYYWKDQTGGTVPSDAGQVILANCTNIRIEGQDISNGSLAIALGFCSNCNIIGNNVSSNYDTGIYLVYSNGNEIMFNNASSNIYGIDLYYSIGNNIINNSASNNFYGIFISFSSENNLINNSLLNNKYGISLSGSPNINLTGNTMLKDGIEIFGNSLGDWDTHNIDTSNTVNGKPVYYWKNQNGGTIPPNAGQVIVANCTNVTIKNQKLPYCSIGIEIGFSLNINITGNDVSWGNQYGIFLYQSQESKITYNNITSNDLYGIFLLGSDNNNLKSNEVSSNNWYGIYLSNCNGNNITDNTAKSNKHSGIRLYSSSNNSIYHNDIIGNINQAYDDRNDNYWDNGYPDGGNYWSDWSPITPDLYDGAITPQITGSSDGICDNPYYIDGDSIDYYPLKYPFGTPPDFEPPTIKDVNASIDSQEVYDFVNISAIVHDNVELGEVWINITDPVGTIVGNFTMDYSINSDRFYYNASYDKLGTYLFTIWANDTRGFWNSSSGIFNIVDSTPPLLSNITINPYIQEVFDNVNISAMITDNFDLYNVRINITRPDGSSINITMEGTPGDLFFLNQSYDLIGIFNFTIWANDTSNNWNHDIGTFAMWDSTIPQGIAEISHPYWKNSLTFPIAWTASDNVGLSNVTLLFRYSSDNSSWSSWTEYLFNNTISGTSASGSFQFIASVNGYYEFFVNASDTEGNWEPNPSDAEAITGVDTLPPTSTISPLSLYWINFSPLSLGSSATDGLSGVKDVTLWYRYSVNNISWGFWNSYDTDQTEPWIWAFNFPNGEGYYEFYSTGKDNANNVESKTLKEVLCAYDITPPIANAGEDKEGELSPIITFDGSGSTDNFGIITNYTWTIMKDFAVISILYGLNPSYTFDVVDEYTVTLTVKDPSGNINDDIIIVSIIAEFVDEEPPEIIDSTIPTIQEVHFGVNITAEVSDNIEVFGVWVQIFDPKNDELGNVSMVKVGLSYVYWYESIYSVVGIFNYTIWANDTFDNWALASGSFVIQDTTPPIADAGEDQTINISDTASFDGSKSTDNVEIINYTWNISKDGNLIVMLYGIYPNYKFDNTGIYNVTLTVKDAVGNIDNDVITVTVESPKKPSQRDYFWLILLIILVIVIVIFYFLSRRRKKKTLEEELETQALPTEPFESQTSPVKDVSLPPSEEESLEPREREDGLSSIV